MQAINSTLRSKDRFSKKFVLNKMQQNDKSALSNVFRVYAGHL